MLHIFDKPDNAMHQNPIYINNDEEHCGKQSNNDSKNEVIRFSSINDKNDSKEYIHDYCIKEEESLC